MKTHHEPSNFHSPAPLRTLIGTLAIMLALLGCSNDARLSPPDMDAATIERQAQAFVDALKPRRPGKPVVAVLALNEGTETTDFLLPHAVLKRADVANVQAVATRRGLVTLYPALAVEVAQDLAEFNRTHPAGADYVIVPAMHDDNNPEITAWLRRQASHGARIIGICNGSLVLGQAGLLDGRRYAGHWYYRDTLRERHPTGSYVPHQRYVVDRGVATTTGITASIPATLALVEAIGGRDKAQAIADEIGVNSWTPAHDSSPFGVNFRRGFSYLVNKVAFWRHQRWSVDVKNGMDDIALALATDVWSRTGRVSVDATSTSSPVTLRSGIVLLAQQPATDRPRLPLTPTLEPVQQLDHTLCQIAEWHGVSG